MKFLNFITIIVFITNANTTKLNYPRVLLPIFDKVSINFTLDAIETGCFKWTTGSELIKLTPVFNDNVGRCSAQVVVSVLTKEKHRNTAIVLAENLSTGEIIRCDVILDVIDKLAVLTTTRELYLEEAPETFELLAQDSQGNAFTTLEGVEFSWKISTQNNYQSRNDENWKQVLRFLRFSESKYHEVPKTVEKIESQGLKGYMVLLEGFNTGSAKVTVEMPYQEYNHVHGVEVDIMVLANILLDPSDVSILVGDSINFRVLQLKQGKLQEISMNSQYFLEVENSELALMDGSTATGKKVGKTVVILRDRNVADDKSNDKIKSLSPRSTLNVAKADKIALSLLPHNNWVTVEGERHSIAIDLFTWDDQKILLGTKYKMQSEFDTEMFFELSRTRNSSRIYGEAIKSGKNHVTGRFENLNAENEMLVYKKLQLTPILVVLPYDPSFPAHHQLSFKATGGDGFYTWTSLNPQLATISQTGVVDTKFENLKRQQNLEIVDDHLGKFTQIKVSLTKNLKISKTADILFLPPIKLEVVQYNFETPLKDYVKLHVALYSSYNNSLLPYTVCDNLNFDLDFSNQIFVEDTTKHNEDELAENACRIFYLKSTNLGSTSLKISYKFNNKILNDEVNLYVFEKLNIFNPMTNEIILPIGSSRNVIYKYGPTKVYSIEAELNKKYTYDKKLIEVHEYQNDFSKENHVFNILCKKLGETKFKFEIYNYINSKYYVPYISLYETNVFCVKPRFINLYTSDKIKDGCPLQRRNSLLHVKNLENSAEIDIEVLDDKNRKLLNITSLALEWKFFSGDKLKLSPMDYIRKREDDSVESVPIPKRDFLRTVLSDVNKNFKIKGTVVDYDKEILINFNIQPEFPQFGIQKLSTGPLVTPVIENELNFFAVDNTLLPFDSLSIYLSKKKVERVKLSQGSGHYEINMNDRGIVNVEFDEQKSELVITPIRIGDVRIDILDRCLMTDPAHLYISIVSVKKIEVQMADRVEKTKSVEAIVRLFDSNDRPLNLDNNNLEIYDLYEEIYNPNLVNVKLGGQMYLGAGEVRYIVTGNELGETKIIFSTGKLDNKISSSPTPIQVFPPLRLYPRNATLLIGSSIQIYSTGGPYPDVNIVYSVQHDDIASMDSSVVTGVKLGETKVVGRCIGTDPATGNSISFSEDFVIIRVIPFDKIKIKVPLVKIRAGATMPASIWGIPDISPMILGSLSSLKVSWSTNQPDVVELNSVFADAGIQYKEEDSISIRVRGFNPGKATITATVIKSNGVKLEASVEVHVFKMLELDSPKKIFSDSILIAPKSNIQLKANLDDTIYDLESNSDSTTSVIKVSRSGVVTSSETIGRSLVIASSADQTLPIPIEVKNIHYILASLHPSNLKLNSVESKIPLGFNLFLRITLHDNLGNEFSHNLENLDSLKFKLSRKEMVDVKLSGNFSISLNLIRETSSVIAISLKDSSGVKYSEDYLKLSVGPSTSIYPTRTLYSVGDIICFDSHVDSSSKWISADDSVLSIDEETGVGQILSNRLKHGDKVSVYQGEKNLGSLRFDLEIREADKIEFFKAYDIINGEKYRAHLIVKNHIQVDKTSNMFAKNNTICASKLDSVILNFFTCKLITHQKQSTNILKHFKTTAIFDKNIGAYGCDIILLTNINELSNLIKNNEINFELEAKLQNGISDTITLKLIPGIVVSPTFLSLEQISNQDIIVTGLDKVLEKVVVKSSDSSVLEVSQISKTPNSINYKIKLLQPFAEDRPLYVEINSPITQQNIELLIQTTSGNLKCSTLPFYGSSSSDLLNIISKFGLIISAVIVILASIFIILFFVQKSQSQNDPIFLSPKKNGMKKSNETFIASPDLSYGSMYRNDLSGQNTSGQSPQHSPPESPIYGDTTLLSQRRVHRRFL